MGAIYKVLAREKNKGVFLCDKGPRFDWRTKHAFRGVWGHASQCFFALMVL